MSQYDNLYDVDDKPKHKRDEDPTTWADAWKATGIFATAYITLTVIAWISEYFIFSDLNTTYLEIILSAGGTQQSGLLDTYISGIQNPTPAFLLPALVVATGLMIIGLFIIYGIIHALATRTQGGEGTLRGLIVRAHWRTTGIFIICSLSGIFLSYYIMSSVVSRYEGVNILATNGTMLEFNQFLTSQKNILYGFYFIGWLAWCVSVGFVIAKNYHIVKKKAFLTIAYSIGVLLFLSRWFVFVLSFLLVQTR